MHKHLVLFLIGLFFLTGKAVSSELKPHSTISSVQVFQSQAVVSRIFQVDLSPGVHTLILDNISSNIDPQSLECAVNGVELRSVKTRVDYLSPDNKPDWVTKLEDSLRIVHEYLADYKADKETIVYQKDLLLANKSIGGSAGVKADELEDVVNLLERKLNSFKNDWFRLTRQEEKWNAIAAKLAAQLGQWQSSLKSGNHQIVIEVKTIQAMARIPFEVKYRVNQVSWTPVYDIRVKDINSPVQFFLKARIQQQTGEDWKDVKLTVNTANPLSKGQMPNLNPAYLEYYNPNYRQLNVVNAYRGNVYKKKAEDDAEQDKRSSSFKYAEINEQMTQIQFDLAQVQTILSGEAEVTVDLATLSLAGEFYYSAVPKLDNQAYLTVKVPADDLLNQIKGDAQVFLQGNFTGNTFVGNTVNDSLQLSLGADSRIVIERVKLREFSKRNLLGNSKIEQSNYEIRVRNTRKEAIRLILEDQIPISRNGDISVKVLNTGNANFQEDSGKLTWSLNVAASEQQKVNFGFELKYPASKTINPY